LLVLVALEAEAAVAVVLVDIEHLLELAVVVQVLNLL
jgi:hypothetical protein